MRQFIDLGFESIFYPGFVWSIACEYGFTNGTPSFVDRLGWGDHAREIGTRFICQEIKDAVYYYYGH